MRRDRLAQEHAARNTDASVAPLALAMMPMGALESRVGNAVSSRRTGASRAQSRRWVAAVIGGPMVLAGTANAGRLARPRPDRASLRPAEAIPVHCSINSSLKCSISRSRRQRAKRDEKRKAAAGPKARRPTSSSTRSCRNSARSATSWPTTEPEESAQAASDREFRRYMMMGGGAGFRVGTRR